MNSLLLVLKSLTFSLVLVSGALVALAQVPSTLLRRFAQHDPNRKVLFVLSLEEQGQAGPDCNWSSKGTGRFALLPTWDGARGVDPGLNLPPEMKAKLGLKTTATAEDLFDLRGGFLGLKVGERLQFYRKESQSQASGKCGEKGSWVESVRDGVTVRTEDGHTSTEREQTADNADAWLVRTETGARLWYRWWIGEGIWGVSANNSGWPTPESTRVRTFELTHEDLRRWGTLDKNLSGPITYKEDSSVSGRVTAHLTTQEFEDEIEASVEIAGYEDWIPEGNLGEPEQPGNTVQIKARAHKKDQPSQPLDKKVNFTFSLEGVSMEPGVCMNWPPKPSSDYGLKILEDRNKELNVLGPDSARSRQAGQQASLTVSTFSYGAWGRLKVEAVTVDGTKLKVRFQDKEVETIPLPYYEHNDHIPVAWLKQHDLLGKPADWDGERDPVGNGFDGDGLTLYEEYRGFAVKGKHVTGHPTKKDVFIHDETGQAEGGIALFEKITGLMVHRVDLEELGTGRVVNRNHDQGPHIVDQHGLLIIQGKKGTSAEAVGIKPNLDPGPPGTCKHIQLPPPPKDLAGQAMEDRIADIAHELCHSVGVFHHGEDFRSVIWWWEQNPDKAWQLFEDGLTGDPDMATDELQRSGKARRIRALREANGSELRAGLAMPQGSAWDERLHGYKLLLMPKQGQCSGDTSCVMRYMDRQAWMSSADSALRYIPDPAGWVPRDLLCTSAEGTGVNALHHKPESRYGNALKGNCKGQIVVNDKYAK